MNKGAHNMSRFISTVTTSFVLMVAAPMMALAQGGDAPKGGMLDLMLPMLLMFGVIYLLIIRPQKKQAEKHQNFLKNLAKGEEVVTTGGLVGKITGIADATVTLEIGERNKVKVLKSHVSRTFQPNAVAKEAAVKAVK
jgi:preprotein translocase subunit YajC